MIVSNDSIKFNHFDTISFGANHLNSVAASKLNRTTLRVIIFA